MVGVMLTKNLDNIIDHLVYYVNQLKTSAKSNCSITKNKSLAMTYVVRKV
jgi:hypothetical protein